MKLLTLNGLKPRRASIFVPLCSYLSVCCDGVLLSTDDRTESMDQPGKRRLYAMVERTGVCAPVLRPWEALIRGLYELDGIGTYRADELVMFADDEDPEEPDH